MTELSRLERTRAWGIGLALLTATISGFAIFINGYAVKRLPDPTLYTTAKNGVAAVVLLALLAPAWRDGGRVAARRTPSSRAGWLTLVVLGAIGGSVPFVLFFEGLARASSARSAFIHKTLVVWVVLLAVPLLRERLSVLHVGAIAALVAGQALLVGDVGSLSLGSGEAMIAAATLLWAIEVVVAKHLLSGVGSLVVGGARMGVGLCVLLAWVAVSGRAGDLVSMSATQWAWAVLTGAILAAYVGTWFAALARAQAVDVTAVLVFGAVVTALLDGGVRGVPLEPSLTGLGLVTVGAAAAAIASLRRGRVVAS